MQLSISLMSNASKEQVISNIDYHLMVLPQLKRSREDDDAHQDNTNAVFPFLRLPRKLRDLIYGHLFSFDGVQRCIDKYNEVFQEYRAVLRNPHLIEEFKRTPSILLVSRQLYAEASPWLGNSDLCITTPLLSSDFSGLGLSFGSALIPDPVLIRMKRIRFRFQIWDYIYFDHCNEGQILFSDAGVIFGMPGSWNNIEEDRALVHSAAWAVLWVHVLQVWEANPMDQRELFVEQELRTCTDEDELSVCVTTLRYAMPTNPEEASTHRSC
jgi:hypothetical protein